MIWKKCLLKAQERLGKMRLRILCTNGRSCVRQEARSTPWTDEQIALDDREVTRNEQRFIIPIPYQRFPKCQKARDRRERAGHYAGD